MRRTLLIVLLATMLSGCKTGGFIPTKFEGGNWNLAERFSNLVELLVGGEPDGAEAGQHWFGGRR